MLHHGADCLAATVGIEEPDRPVVEREICQRKFRDLMDFFF